jgi:hypothetical protein
VYGKLAAESPIRLKGDAEELDASLEGLKALGAIRKDDNDHWQLATTVEMTKARR